MCAHGFLLKHLPAEFVLEPSQIAPDQQKLSDVQIGYDYPVPMVDLEKSYERIRNEG